MSKVKTTTRIDPSSLSLSTTNVKETATSSSTPTIISEARNLSNPHTPNNNTNVNFLRVIPQKKLFLYRVW